jgi:hypothetical protein
MHIQMNTGHVAQAGDNLAALAGGARDRTAKLFENCDAAISGNAGWLSAGALRALRQIWADHVAKLIDDTAAIAQALNDSASMVAASDQEAEQRMKKVLEAMDEMQK